MTGSLETRPVLRRGLRRQFAAEYIGVGLTKFDEMVAENLLPQPRMIDAIKIWDKFDLDDWFNDLPALRGSYWEK